MHKKEQALQQLLRQKLLPLYYHPGKDVSLDILQALYEGGVRIVEYTNRGENALENFSHIRQIAATQMPDLLLGIGTIKNAEQARQYTAAGADFIVAPTVNEEVAAVAHGAGLLWVPGCMTPTEIAVAEAAGARLVKIFPGNILGPAYITAIKELFPAVQFMPTGGVEGEEKNLKAWFSAGVAAVGMGSKLITKEAVQQGDYVGLKKKTEEVLQLIKAAAGAAA